jgi:beta-lactam-binding protein with PASTA domain
MSYPSGSLSSPELVSGRRSRWVVRGAGAVVVVACIAAIGAPSPRKVAVPKLVGLDISEATAELPAGLKAVSADASILGRVVGSDWRVVEQVPEAGAAVFPGATITLKVIKPGEIMVHPDDAMVSAAAGAAAAPRARPAET